MSKPVADAYIINSVVHAAEILGAFRAPGECLRLRDVVERTGFGKGMCFRLLHTLHDCGWLEKESSNLFRLSSELRHGKRFRVGYAAQGQDSSFPAEVLSGLQRAAEREQIDLIVLDNRYQPRIAVRNAEQLVREQVDLAVEFQTDEAIAPAIAARYLDANIPFIAIDIPHPGGTYFGANNYQAGLLAGRYLGQWDKVQWNGRVQEVLLLELARAGSLVHARMSGVMAGLRETMREKIETCSVVSLDCDGQFKTSLEKVRRHLRQSKADYVLVGAANDPSALGAARAFQEAGRADTCAIVGQNAEPDARTEMRERRRPLVASVGFFPERYGDAIIKLAVDILAHRRTPPAVFTRHHIITPENVDHFYPNDSLESLAAPQRADARL
jgi:ribose transport system substrate-binding protein